MDSSNLRWLHRIIPDDPQKKVQLQEGKEVLPEKSVEITNTYDLGGDGKVYRPNDENWKRK